MGHAEAERQARQKIRHERRHRLEKSYSEMAISEQCSDCPTCHVNSDPTRHSICCVARHSPSRRHVIDQTNKSTEEDTYNTISKDSPKTAVQTLKGLLSLHTLDQDTFWTCSEDPATSQSATLPHGTHGNRNTPKPILERASHESIDSVDLESYQTSPPDKAIWKTPTIRISPAGEYNDVPELQQDVRYDDDGNTGEQQRQGLSHRGIGSPVRKANDWTPKTSEKGLGSQDSLRKATSASKSPQRSIESSDPSTWKQQLRKINDTPTLMSNSPSKEYTLLASGSQRNLNQPTLERNQAGDVMKEPTIPPVTPKSDSEISLGRHVCEWRSRYLGLSDAFDKLKIELDIALEHQASQGISGGELGGASHQHQYDDYGIEGLTIIVHRRSKEDLVLNTDLREEEPAQGEEQ